MDIVHCLKIYFKSTLSSQEYFDGFAEGALVVTDPFTKTIPAEFMLVFRTHLTNRTLELVYWGSEATCMVQLFAPSSINSPVSGVPSAPYCALHMPYKKYSLLVCLVHFLANRTLCITAHKDTLTNPLSNPSKTVVGMAPALTHIVSCWV